jgi:hypothetical protein
MGTESNGSRQVPMTMTKLRVSKKQGISCSAEWLLKILCHRLGHTDMPICNSVTDGRVETDTWFKRFRRRLVIMAVRKLIVNKKKCERGE